MTNHDLLPAIYEALLEQQKALRECRIQIESLKEMMFEHRPQFRESFAGVEQRVSQGRIAHQFNATLGRLQQQLRAAPSE